MSATATFGSTAVQHVDSSVESGHIAAIIVCIFIGLTAVCYAIYRLSKRYCPNMLDAITPQEHPTLAVHSAKQQSEYEQRATEMASHMAAGDKAERAKKSDSHVVDVQSPLSANEQWTVRDAPAEDE